jgi:hypothetical protein
MGLGPIPATGGDPRYAGTILLGQLGVLGNLEASLRK